MKWVTLEKLGYNRPACIWLIRRFVDPEAEFILLPPEGILEKAKEMGAKVFHAVGAEYLADGESKTTFDKILEGEGLKGKDPALDLMAEIINDGTYGFRLGKPMRHPEGAGVWALNMGFKVSAPEDQDRMEKLQDLYEALYCYCQGKLAPKE